MIRGRWRVPCCGGAWILGARLRLVQHPSSARSGSAASVNRGSAIYAACSWPDNRRDVKVGRANSTYAEPVDPAIRTTHLCHRIVECAVLTGDLIRAEGIMCEPHLKAAPPRLPPSHGCTDQACDVSLPTRSRLHMAHRRRDQCRDKARRAKRARSRCMKSSAACFRCDSVMSLFLGSAQTKASSRSIASRGTACEPCRSNNRTAMMCDIARSWARFIAGYCHCRPPACAGRIKRRYMD